MIYGIRSVKSAGINQNQLKIMIMLGIGNQKAINHRRRKMEPEIIINGIKVTDGMAMTIRVAIETFSVDLQDGLGDDDHGRAITKGYQANIDKIRDLIFNDKPQDNKGEL